MHLFERGMQNYTNTKSVINKLITQPVHEIKGHVFVPVVNREHKENI